MSHECLQKKKQLYSLLWRLQKSMSVCLHVHILYVWMYKWLCTRFCHTPPQLCSLFLNNLKLFILRYNSHTIKLTLLRCTFQWFLVYHKAVQPSPLIPEYFYHPKKKYYKHSQQLLIPLLSYPTLHPLATTSLLSVSMDFSLLNISYKWNHST